MKSYGCPRCIRLSPELLFCTSKHCLSKRICDAKLLLPGKIVHFFSFSFWHYLLERRSEFFKSNEHEKINVLKKRTMAMTMRWALLTFSAVPLIVRHLVSSGFWISLEKLRKHCVFSCRSFTTVPPVPMIKGTALLWTDKVFSSYIVFQRRKWKNDSWKTMHPWAMQLGFDAFRVFWIHLNTFDFEIIMHLSIFYTNFVHIHFQFFFLGK